MKFVPAFQPILNVDTGVGVAAEVLARWHNGERFVPPSHLDSPPRWGRVDIDVAMYLQNNLHACREWQSLLFINVSEETLCSDTLFTIWARLIRSLARKHGEGIVIEITEHIHPDTLAERWEALSETGAAFALDDYGDKHSTLDRLMRYEWSYCKFDAKRLQLPGDCRALAWCYGKRIQLIAEQVETPALAARSLGFGIPWQQGFHHAHPVCGVSVSGLGAPIAAGAAS